jgi:AraC-like DNA-binding protein
MQNYTISALAKEFGYNNTESFSTAFYKQTGIKPSYYIKQLRKTPNLPLDTP